MATGWKAGGRGVGAARREGGREGGRIDEGTIAGGFFRDSW